MERSRECCRKSANGNRWHELHGYNPVGVRYATAHTSASAARTGHQDLAQEFDLLEPECLRAIAVHEKIERLPIAVPPLVRVLATAQGATEHVPIPEEQGELATIQNGRHPLEIARLFLDLKSPNLYLETSQQSHP